MSNTIRNTLALGLLVTAAACAQQQQQQEEEYVVVVPEPISTEPVFTGKYK